MNPIETFFLTECIFKHYLASPPRFVVVKLHIGGNCTSTHFTRFFIFFVQSGLLFSETLIFGLSFHVWYRQKCRGTEDKERSPIPPSNLLNSVPFELRFYMDSIKQSQVWLIWLAYWIIAEVLPEESPPCQIESHARILWSVFFFLLCAESGFKWKNYQNETSRILWTKSHERLVDPWARKGSSDAP